MDKPIRKAVRCYLIKDNEVVVTKYKKGKGLSVWVNGRKIASSLKLEKVTGKL